MSNFISERDYDGLDATTAVEYEESLIETVQNEWLRTFPLVREVQSIVSEYNSIFSMESNWEFNLKLARIEAEMELMYNELEGFEFVGRSSQKILKRMYNKLRSIHQRMERFVDGWVSK